MACSGCAQNAAARNQQRLANLSKLTGVEMHLTRPKGTAIRAHDGKNYALTQLLVRTRPPLGYAAVVRLNDTDHVIDKMTPREVAAAVKEFYSLNGITIPDYQVWYHLNLIWTGSVSPRNAVVQHQLLQAFGEPVPTPTPTEPTTPQASTNTSSAVPDRTITSPGVGSKAWGFLQLYLSVDKSEYDPKIVQTIVLLLKRILETNSIGCPACRDHFEKNTKTLDISDRDKVREWVFTVMNKINADNGRPIMSREQAYLVNLWL